MHTYNPQDPTKKNSKIIFLALLVSRIIIGVGIWWVFFRETPDLPQPVDTPSETEQNAQRRYIGEKILLSGELIKRSGFGLSTHMFTDINGNEFGARSETINLSEYEGEVQIKGEIVDFDKETPIILVQDSLKIGTDNGNNEIPEGNENFWYSQSAGIGIDLSVSQGYDVSEQDSEIRIVEATNPAEALLSIQPFDCVTGDPLQDCIDLQDKFTRFGNESFTNAQGVTFYNLTETNTWFIFDIPTKGYSLRSNTTNSVSAFSDLIQIVNDETIDALVDDNISEYCRSLESRMDTVQETDVKLIKQGLLEVNLTGASDQGNEVTCSMYIRLGEANTVLPGSYNDDSNDEAYEQEVITAQEQNQEETVGDSQEVETQPTPEAEEIILDETPEENEDEPAQEDEPIDEQEALAVEVGSVIAPTSLDGWLQYASVRGFDMYFSKQGVSYVGEILENADSLGMSNAQCAYRVNVIAWQQADNVSTSPDLAVYECTGTAPTQDQAIALNLQLAGSTEDTFFVVERYTTNLGDIQVYVE